METGPGLVGGSSAIMSPVELCLWAFVSALQGKDEEEIELETSTHLLVGNCGTHQWRRFPTVDYLIFPMLLVWTQDICDDPHYPLQQMEYEGAPWGIAGR